MSGPAGSRQPDSAPPEPAPRPRPRESLDRCALRAQLRGDAMIGTAFPAARLLLVEQPGPWGRAGLRESRFDLAVATALERRANDAGVRVHAIRRPGRTPRGEPRCWAFVDTRTGHETIRWATYERDHELLDAPLCGSAGTHDSAPIFLVCAHSKHDPCCALRGRNVAAALAEHRPGRVWECTHVGGDRFAANVLVLPAGLLYGRLLPFAAAEFAAAADAGEVVGALLRGRVGLPPHVQAALAHCYEQLALRHVGELSVLGHTPVADGAATVRLGTPHGPVEVAVRVERVAADGLTCAAPGAGHYLRYRPTAIKSSTE